MKTFGRWIAREFREVPPPRLLIFSAGDGCDVGEAAGSPVSEDYGPHGNAFSARVHPVSPEDAVRMARARR